MGNMKSKETQSGRRVKSLISTRRRGIGLTEVVFALAVVVLAIVGLVASLLHAMDLDQSSRETELALNAAREVIETMRGSGEFSDIYGEKQQYPHG